MGGKPNPGTKKDKRLKKNRTKSKIPAGFKKFIKRKKK